MKQTFGQAVWQANLRGKDEERIMTKRSRRPHKRRNRGPAQKAKSGAVGFPSAATLFRFSILDPSMMGLMGKAMSMLKPVLWIRDGEDVGRIRQAGTAEEVLDLLPLARGLGEPEWYERMRQFGPGVVPLISERLRTVQRIRDKDLRDMTVEKLMGALRPHGDAVASVLLERFDDLNEYGQSLACVMLGVFGAEAGADRIWRFFQETANRSRDLAFVGALWGLIDLKDERASLALIQLLKNKRFFYELFGFFSLAGDARTVLPLMEEAQRRPDESKSDPIMAFVGVAQRIGREALLAEFEKAAAADDAREDLEAMVDRVLARSIEDVQEYFELFYRGPTPDDLERSVPGRA
jgi:hypothetical protein